MIYTKEIDFNGIPIKITWNGNSQISIQSIKKGQWQDVDIITCYGMKDKHDALAEALDTLKRKPEWVLTCPEPFDI